MFGYDQGAQLENKDYGMKNSTFGNEEMWAEQSRQTKSTKLNKYQSFVRS